MTGLIDIGLGTLAFLALAAIFAPQAKPERKPVRIRVETPSDRTRRPD